MLVNQETFDIETRVAEDWYGSHRLVIDLKALANAQDWELGIEIPDNYKVGRMYGGELTERDGKTYLSGNNSNNSLNSGDSTEIILVFFEGESASLDPIAPTFSFAEPVDSNSQGSINDDNTLYGTSGNDTLFTGDGDDLAYGYAGKDRLTGFGGDDSLFGGVGDDKIYGDEGNDSMVGGAGNDSIWDGTGDDVLEGGDGNDRLDAHIGNDTLIGGDGDDLLMAGEDVAWEDKEWGPDKDFLDGGAGNDTLSGGAEEDLLIGGSGNDRMGGTSGNDTLFGDQGMDSLFGGVGEDLMFGGAGNDRFWGNEGNDSMSGDNGDDKLLGIEGDDILVGGNGQDTLDGGSGSDIYVLEHNSGADLLQGFKDGVDLLGLSEGLSFADLTFVRSGNGTEISKDGDLLATVSNVRPNLIDQSDFVTGGFDTSSWS